MHAELKITDNRFNPIGAGKMTLISVLTGLYEPTSGIGHVAGYDISTDIQKNPPLLGGVSTV